MTPLRKRLQQARVRHGVAWNVIEKDYVLSWFLAALAHAEMLRESIVFKGGTALRKCYFGEYRFSEDLDFSALENAPRGDAMEGAVGETCRIARERLRAIGNFDVSFERYTEREPHPHGQEAFAIRVRMPWQRQAQTRILLEITVDEPIVRLPVHRGILHDYGETIDETVLVYSIEEIVAEKLRAILQHAAKLRQRGWSRSRARDYYDLWRLFSDYGHEIDAAAFPELLRAKCDVRGMAFSGPDDFFQEQMVRTVNATWEQWLGPLVPDLPPFDAICEPLRGHVARLIATGA